MKDNFRNCCAVQNEIEDIEKSVDIEPEETEEEKEEKVRQEMIKLKEQKIEENFHKTQDITLAK